VHLIISSQKHVTDQVNVKVVNSTIRGKHRRGGYRAAHALAQLGCKSESFR